MDKDFSVINFINIKKSGKNHSREEIECFISGVCNGSIKDYQISAWLMAAYIKDLSLDETTWLTMAIANSGDVLDLSHIEGPVIDKHSTGGVGDKTTLIALPMLAACGVKVIKMSGGGLGITGGTSDKLASIPGFNLSLSSEELVSMVNKVGIGIAGLNKNIAPADKILYAIRDTTGTVDSLPLITASILGKKIATGAKHIVIDVKCGSGAFMKDMESAKKLAAMLKKVGGKCGVTVLPIITDMNQILGESAGNALEIVEAIVSLTDIKKSRLMDLSIMLAANSLYLLKLTESVEEGARLVEEKLKNGEVLEKAKRWLCAQGAPEHLFEKPYNYLENSTHLECVKYNGPDVWVSELPAESIGEAVLGLGGGRKHKDDVIDYSVGIRSFIEVGTKVTNGMVIFQIHSKNKDDADRVKNILLKNVKFASHETVQMPVLLDDVLFSA